MRHLCLGFALLAAGCGTAPPAGDDLSGVEDMAVTAPDQAMDLAATAQDLSVPIDLTGNTDDLTVIVDMARGANVDMLLPPTVIPYDQWLAFCKAFTACQIWGRDVINPAKGLSDCLNAWPKPGTLPFEPKSVLSCIGNAGNDCKAISTCLNNGNPNYGCNNDAGIQATCAGDVFSLCLSGLAQRYALDCAALNLVCVTPGGNKLPGCGFGGCMGTAESCLGGVRSRCSQDVQRWTEDCRVVGNQACMVVPDGGAQCIGGGNACQRATCSGDTLVLCNGGKEAHFNCADVGLKCLVDGNMVAACRKGTACNPSNYVETCSGTVLTFCDAGVVATLNCAQGWVKCVPKVVPDGGRPTGGYCSQ